MSTSESTDTRLVPGPAPSDESTTTTGATARMLTIQLTGYSWWDNSPPGSATISHPVKHETAGGTGTYEDAITVAVPNSGKGSFGTGEGQFTEGTIFYLPSVKRYGIVEDTGATPASEYPDHNQLDGHLSMWVDGRDGTRSSTDHCMSSFTGKVSAELDPPPDRDVIVGPIYSDHCDIPGQTGDGAGSGGDGSGSGSGGTAPLPRPAPADNTTPGAIRPLPAPVGANVTAITATQARDAVRNAQPGDIIAVLGDLGNVKLKVDNSGTEAAPITIVGDGNTVIGGLRIQADWVHASGLNIIEPDPAPGISIRGDHITVEDCVVDSPSGGDGDCCRFWGGDLVIRHNTFKNTDNDNGHADAMQNFSTNSDLPRTHDVLIAYNRCENIANIGVISEGPNSSADDGDGEGHTRALIIKGNYFQARSSQAIWFDDVQDWVIEDNTFDGGVDKALGCTNKSTGGTFRNNDVRGINCQVGMDRSSRRGYNGPEPTCEP